MSAPSPGQGVAYPHVCAWLRHLAPTTGLILDIGSGAGQYASAVGPDRHVGVDVPETWYAPVHRPRAYASADALPFAPRSFGMALCVAALDYLPRPAAVFAEVKRCLVPGGSLLVATYDRPTLEAIHQRVGTLAEDRSRASHRVFDLDDVHRWASAAGMSARPLPLWPSSHLARRIRAALRPGNHRMLLVTT